MNRLSTLFIAVFLSACSMTTQSLSNASQTELAEDFFTNKIGSCGKSPVVNANINFVNDLLTVTPNRLYNSSSLTVDWNYIGDRVLRMVDMSYKVASTNDEAGAIKLLGIIEDAADKNKFYDWQNWRDVAGSSCWKGPDSKCAYHHPEFVSQFFAGVLITANVLDEYIWPEQREKFNKYFAKMYKRFIKPQAFNDWSSGFYAGANGGLGNLAYARWTRDTRLFAKEINFRKKIIKKHFRKDGWIENNSWRGNRDYWYHTLAVDTVLGYMLIARANGVDLFNDPVIGPRVYASLEKTVLGNKSLKEFSKKGYKGKNHITGKKDARPHMHQEATNLVLIAKKEYGITIKPRAEHFRRQNGQENVNALIGFNASCYYRSN